MRNNFRGRCYRCGLFVEPGQGHFEKANRQRLQALRLPIDTVWLTQHRTCAIYWAGSFHSYNNDVPPDPTIKEDYGDRPPH